jgi:hypothetical protein
MPFQQAFKPSITKAKTVGLKQPLTNLPGSN